MGIIREEMDTIGLEMLMPVLQPAELWQTTGRYDIDVLFKLEDSSGKPYVLAITHEECVTLHAAREIRSYRELPQIWYHQQTKERDEPRPRGGILRTREFIMKDSYSFDRDLAGLEESYAKHRDVYVRIFDRCGLETYAVEADVGMMGGHGGEEFVAPEPERRGRSRAVLELRLRRQRRGGALACRGAPSSRRRSTRPRRSRRRARRPSTAWPRCSGSTRRPTAKAMPIVADGEVVLALVRGDDRLHEMKTRAGARADATARPPPDEIREAFGADPGSIGPVGAKVRVIADESLREGQYVGGANRTGWHLRGVEAGRDYEAEFHDLREVAAGDTCAACGEGTLQHRAGDRGWPHLQAGHAATPCRSAPPTWTRPARSTPS